mmetsp:Transcript_46355/g.122170  ORF Transcript_46355/g.122170 Transcript_46355/m.122170 type:complete len:84 (+) Transcript_46355:498-749(+)
MLLSSRDGWPRYCTTCVQPAATSQCEEELAPPACTPDGPASSVNAAAAAPPAWDAAGSSQVKSQADSQADAGGAGRSSAWGIT